MPSYDLFISYRRLDAPRVHPLVDCLRGLGLEVWIDEAEIEDFAAVTRTITEVLAQSKAVLAWYSAIYPDSRPASGNSPPPTLPRNRAVIHASGCSSSIPKRAPTTSPYLS